MTRRGRFVDIRQDIIEGIEAIAADLLELEKQRKELECQRQELLKLLAAQNRRFMLAQIDS